jgi:hypothetical protein
MKCDIHVVGYSKRRVNGLLSRSKEEMMKKIAWRSLAAFLASVLLIGTVGTALAWQVYPAFGHAARYGGEADSGNLGGQLEFPSGQRWVRASGEHVKWTSSGVSWIASHTNSIDKPAMVFHVFQLNADDCGNFRSEGYSGWNWSNLPGYYLWGKATCGSGKQNEIRFIATGTIVAGTEYYYQSVFKDQTYPGTWSDGRVTTDSYWDRNLGITHEGVYKDFHTKFCITTGATVYIC